MTKYLERMKEIEARKAELAKEIEEGNAGETRLAEIRKEASGLKQEQEDLRGKLELKDMLKPGAVPDARTADVQKTTADRFTETGRMSMPMFKENRSLLVSSGTLATPTAVATEIGQLPETICSIVDDVEVIDATGTGAWDFPYQKTDAEAADVTEGNTIGGSGATYDKVAISPGEWGVLDEISNQVSKMTNVAYAAAVQNSAYLALRKKAKEKITTAIVDSELTEKRYSVAIDETYVRNVVLGYDSDESVAGGTKLYLNKTDLAAIGDIRGTNEKKAVFDITFTDENNGVIKDGGTIVPFSINSSLETGTQLYGKPRTVKMLLWGDYEVKTDEGGDYFKRNMMGIRGLVTAGADLTTWHGMQIIKQSAAPVGDV